MVALLITLILSAALCGLYIRLARHWRFLDRPNERSSHQNPTPHGGGVPLLTAFAVGCAYTMPWGFDYLWLLAVTFTFMVLGVVDDMRSLPVSLRLVLYAIASVATAAVLLRSSVVEMNVTGLVQLLCLAFAIMWALNLYNFMDGIDGIAATQCVLACGAAAFLAWSGGGSGKYALFCLLLGASQLGFLVWNWAPARLFLGDAGSVPTGFLLAGLAAYGALSGAISFACWGVLMALFITDTSYTLAWRMADGQNFTRAHKLHAYQRLSRHWGSHRAVVLLLLAVNLLWLIPIAWTLQLWPEHTVYLVILAYIPLFIGMAKTGKLT